MQMEFSESHGFTLITLSGQISQLKDSIHLKSAITSLLEEKKNKIALLLHNMDYIDSAAINVFIYARNQIEKSCGKFCIVEPNDYVMDVIGVVGLKDYFTILSDKEALKNA